jgi:hypothetical protein
MREGMDLLAATPKPSLQDTQDMRDMRDRPAMNHISLAVVKKNCLRTSV